MQRGDNPRLAVAGFLLTMFDRRLAVHLTYEAMLRQLYGDRVFAAAIPREGFRGGGGGPHARRGLQAAHRRG